MTDNDETSYCDLDAFMADLGSYENGLGFIRRWVYARSFRGYNGLYWCRNPWKLVTEAPGGLWRDVRKSRQRSRRGWANEDTWSLDSYLLGWLPDAIDYLRETDESFPGRGNASTPEAWAKILDDMAHGLSCGRALVNGDYDSPAERDSLQADFDAGWALFSEWFFDLWT